MHNLTAVAEGSLTLVSYGKAPDDFISLDYFGSVVLGCTGEISTPFEK